MGKSEVVEGQYCWEMHFAECVCTTEEEKWDMLVLKIKIQTKASQYLINKTNLVSSAQC